MRRFKYNYNKKLVFMTLKNRGHTPKKNKLYTICRVSAQKINLKNTRRKMYCKL